MVCTSPHIAYEAIGVRNPDTGKKIIRYSSKGMTEIKYSFPVDYKVFRCSEDVYPYDYKQVKLPCGQCISCRIDRSRNWALRNYHEASISSSSCFITLTFGDDTSVDNVFRLREFALKTRSQKFKEARKRCNTLVRGDFSKFMKRLRDMCSRGFTYVDEKSGCKMFCQKTDNIRFYACGEYGEAFERPHYHALIYNFSFPDRKYLGTDDLGNPCYTSELLSKAWGYGFVYITDFSVQAANYVSRYVTKKINGRLKDAWYRGREPEYQLCSNRPGIGRAWFEKYMSDVYPRDEVILPKKGKKIKLKPPKYYDNLFDKFCPDDFKEVKQRRELWISANSKREEWVKENSAPRLAVKDEIMRMRVKKLIRVYERSEYTGINIEKLLSKCCEYGIDYSIFDGVKKYKYTSSPPRSAPGG